MEGLLGDKKRLKNHNHQNNVLASFRKLIQSIFKDNQRNMNLYWILGDTEELLLGVIMRSKPYKKMSILFRDICQIYRDEMNLGFALNYSAIKNEKRER